VTGTCGRFHHARTDASGRVVDFLPPEAADAFALRGGPSDIVKQLVDVLRASPASTTSSCIRSQPVVARHPDRATRAGGARDPAGGEAGLGR